MSGNGRILYLGSGDFQREQKDKERFSRLGRNGGGGVRHGWERQRKITLHLTYLIVPKGIDNHAWCSANTVTGFLGFKMIYFHIIGRR
jgi:hypothetical protein